MNIGIKIIKFFKKNILFDIYLIICLYILISFDGFFNSFNIASLLGLGSIIGFLVLGESLIILLGGIDLSVGNIASLSSVILAWVLITFEGLIVPPLLIFAAISAALLSGSIIGYINGFTVTKLKIPPIIATLGGMWIAVGLAEFVFSGVPKSLPFRGFKYLGRWKLFGIFPLPFLVFIVAVIIVFLILTRTKKGRHLYAVGGGEEAAHQAGINTGKIKLISYILSGLLSAVGGIFLASWMMVGDSRAAMGYEFIAITAVVMGGFSLFGGVGNIWNAVIGIYMLQTIRKMIPHIGISPFYEDGIVGFILLISIIINVTLAHRKRSA